MKNALKIIVALLLVLATGYSVFWFYTASNHKKELAQSLSQLTEKHEGLKLSYESISSRGFPTQFIYDIHNIDMGFEAEGIGIPHLEGQILKVKSDLISLSGGVDKKSIAVLMPSKTDLELNLCLYNDCSQVTNEEDKILKLSVSQSERPIVTLFFDQDMTWLELLNSQEAVKVNRVTYNNKGYEAVESKSQAVVMKGTGTDLDVSFKKEDDKTSDFILKLKNTTETFFKDHADKVTPLAKVLDYGKFNLSLDIDGNFVDLGSNSIPDFKINFNEMNIDTSLLKLSNTGYVQKVDTLSLPIVDLTIKFSNLLNFLTHYRDLGIINPVNFNGVTKFLTAFTNAPDLNSELSFVVKANGMGSATLNDKSLAEVNQLLLNATNDATANTNSETNPNDGSALPDNAVPAETLPTPTPVTPTMPAVPTTPTVPGEVPPTSVPQVPSTPAVPAVPTIPAVPTAPSTPPVAPVAPVSPPSIAPVPAVPPVPTTPPAAPSTSSSGTSVPALPTPK